LTQVQAQWKEIDSIIAHHRAFYGEHVVVWTAKGIARFSTTAA
jgi:hypothetical protein